MQMTMDGAGVLFKEICKLFPRITLQILIIWILNSKQDNNILQIVWVFELPTNLITKKIKSKLDIVKFLSDPVEASLTI